MDKLLLEGLFVALIRHVNECTNIRQEIEDEGIRIASVDGHDGSIQIHRGIDLIGEALGVKTEFKAWDDKYVKKLHYIGELYFYLNGVRIFELVDEVEPVAFLEGDDSIKVEEQFQNIRDGWRG